MQIISQRSRPESLIRTWDLDEERYPSRTPQQWAELIKAAKDGRGLTQVFEDHNHESIGGMSDIAAMCAGTLAAWQNGRWYAQAIGTGTATPVLADRNLTQELYRKLFAAPTQSTNSVYALTVFTSAEYANHATTVLGAPAPTTTTFTVAAASAAGPPATALAVGDLIRIQLTSGYEYHTITALSGAAVTLGALDACSIAPVVGATIQQVTAEGGIFGDLPAGTNGGTVTVTNGSAVVTGIGTNFTGNVAAGDQFRISSSRKFYAILSVDSATQLTLTANYGESTLSGQAYWLRGTMFNHVNGLNYIKLSTRGYAYENQWTWGA